MDLEQLKSELWHLNKNNRWIDTMLERERRRKRRYDWLMSIGLEEEAAKTADSVLSHTMGKDIARVSDLERKYIEAFEMLPPLECEMAKMRYFDGEPYKSIGCQIGYSESSVKHIFTGRKDRGEIGIIGKLLHIINKGEG